MNAHDHVFLAWASKTSESERTINLVRSRDGGRAFETPATIAKTGVYRSTSKGTGKMGYERRANPHVVADGATVHLCWGSGSAKGMEQLIATSTDKGLTFGTPRRIDREPANPTFTAFTAGPHGELACTWLSDRGSAQLPYASLRPAGAGSSSPNARRRPVRQATGSARAVPPRPRLLRTARSTSATGTSMATTGTSASAGSQSGPRRSKDRSRSSPTPGNFPAVRTMVPRWSCGITHCTCCGWMRTRVRRGVITAGPMCAT